MNGHSHVGGPPELPPFIFQCPARDPLSILNPLGVQNKAPDAIPLDLAHAIAATESRACRTIPESPLGIAGRRSYLREVLLTDTCPSFGSLLISRTHSSLTLVWSRINVCSSGKTESAVMSASVTVEELRSR